MADPERGGGGGSRIWIPHGKSYVAKGFLRNSGTDPTQEGGSGWGIMISE